MPDSLTGDISRFRPKTLTQFLLFHIAFRLDDLRNLGRYLNLAAVTRSTLIAAAHEAERQTIEDGSPAPLNFFRMLDGLGKEAL